MGEYYGVASSSDFFAHYGVKGMKWGVRRARKSGNAKRLGRQYAKAQRKLQKLEKRTDVNAQKQLADKMNKVSKIARRAGHVGAAVGGLTVPYGNWAEKLYSQQHKNFLNRQSDLRKQSWDAGEKYEANKWLIENAKKNSDNTSSSRHNYNTLKDSNYDEYHNTTKNIQKQNDAAWEQYHNNAAARDRRIDFAKAARYGGIGLAAAGYGTAIGAKVKAHAAKKRTTAEGHQKAVAERDAWKKEMQRVFKGTKYASLPQVQKKAKKKKR